MAASLILSNLAYTTPDGRLLFSGLDLTFGSARTGLVGRNGVGKTSLLKLISGELRPRSGRVSASGRLAIFHQTVPVNPCEAVADLFDVTDALAILHRAERGESTDDELADADWTLEARMTVALSRLGLNVSAETPLAILSGGSGREPGSPRLSLPSPTSCCWTSRPTTSTVMAERP